MRFVRRKCILVLLVVAVGVSVILTTYPFSEQEFPDPPKNPVILEKIINPPKYISKYHNDTLNELNKNLKSAPSNRTQIIKVKLAEVLSEIVQTQLSDLQKSGHCEGPNIICGNFEYCGLGCEIHTRITCLIISYALSFPLIHDEKKWGYRSSWSEAFYPLGITCPPGPNTYRLLWVARSTPILYKLGDNIAFNRKIKNYDSYPQVEYPLKKGIPVPKVLADLVDIVHENPFIWWIGQFMKFGLRLSPIQEESIQTWKSNAKFQHPIVGFHVRRTDKVREAPHSRHEIEQYIAIADNYFRSINRNSSKNVFIASDDAQVLNETLTKFSSPEWNIIGFNSRTTDKNENDVSRLKKLDEMVQDLFILAECDLVVCGLTSNICRLLLEILNHLHLDGMHRLRSLDGYYLYVLHSGIIIGDVINKI